MVDEPDDGENDGENPEDMEHHGGDRQGDAEDDPGHNQHDRQENKGMLHTD